MNGIATAAGITSSASSEVSSISGIIDFSNVTFDGIILGAILTLLSYVIINLLSHWLSRRRAAEERKESFRLKLYELRVQAAQTAYQYIFKLYRASHRVTTSETGLLLVDTPSQHPSDIAKEFRDWLDGQALILGDSVYKKIFIYINSVGLSNETEQARAMNAAQRALKSILRKDLHAETQ